MKRSLTLVLLLAFSLTSLASVDSFIRLKGPLAKTVNKLLPVAETGKVLYDLQEGAHELVTNTTGIAIPHDYINVCTEDDCLLIDPFRVRN